MQDAFRAPGRFLKGNLHLHTTNSDGEMTPPQAVQLYKRAGYDFLAITDHRHLTDISVLDGDGMVLLPGQELHEGKGELGQTHHILAIGMAEPIVIPPTDDLQESLDYVSARSRLVFIAHPYWTSLTYRDILGRTGFLGIEVFNYTCETGIGRGNSASCWDDLLVRGVRALGIAVDDAHCHYPDTLGGWIMVKAEQATPEAIYSAIERGEFYASSGPTIDDVALQAGAVTVRCSPCQAVHVICSAPGRGATTWRTAPGQGPYTEVTLPVSDDWNPMRVECVDGCGRRAWTNPLWRD